MDCIPDRLDSVSRIVCHSGDTCILTAANRTDIHDKRTYGRSGQIYRLLWISYAAASFAALVSLPLNTLYESGVALNELSWALIGSALKLTSFGQIWMLQILIVMPLAVTILSGYDRDRSIRARIWSSYGSLVLVLGWLFTHAMTGHPAAADQRALAIAMDFVHLIGAAFWIGALTAMAICLPPLADKLPSKVRGEVYWVAIRRFTAWGIGAVAALVATGIYSSLIILPAPVLTSLFTTAYGLVLIGKIVLLIVMLVFAWRHARLARSGNGKQIIQRPESGTCHRCCHSRSSLPY